MFKAMPKNSHGNLGHTTVRYVLHRYFTERHGWYLKGLEPSHNLTAASSPTALVKDRVPDYIQELFEQHLAGQGFDTQNLAVFIATLEHLVHNESTGRLDTAYRMARLPTSMPVSEEDADKVLDT